MHAWCSVLHQFILYSGALKNHAVFYNSGLKKTETETNIVDAPISDSASKTATIGAIKVTRHSIGALLFVRSECKLPSYMVLLHGAIITWCYSVFRNQLFCNYLQTIFKLANLKNV